MQMERAVWQPSPESVNDMKLFQFMQKLGFADYDPFYAQSVADIAWFWDEVVKDIGLPWFQPYERVLDDNLGFAWPKWFVGGKLNAAHIAVDRWLLEEGMRDCQALIWENELGERAVYTYRQLAVETLRAAAGFRSLGIGRGDRVAIYLPMLPETVIAMLALARIGAISIPIYSGFAASTIAARLNASQTKLLITADGSLRKGKPFNMKKEADEAASLSPSVAKVVVVRKAGVSIEWNESRDHSWDELMQAESALAIYAEPQLDPDASALYAACLAQTERMDSSEPLMLLYTSGTTGAPKGIVHTHSGFPIKAAFDAGYGMDVRRGDVLCWVTDMGWMMGPFMLYGALLNGAALLAYEGAPDYPGPGRLWELAERHGVTQLGVSPTLIRLLMRQGDEWSRKHDLSKLRAFCSSGEPWNTDPWLWLFHKVGQGAVPIINYSGGTETSGGILSNILLKPIAPVGFNGPLPGMDAEVYDASGMPVREAIGELVLRKPWVGMASGFWKDDERYERTYFNRWSDVWVHGDWVETDDEGFWYIRGRSDDTLNIAGKRLGPAEMESILVEHSAVLEAATIGVPDELKGEAAVCFVVVNQRYTVTATQEELLGELLRFTEQRLGKALRPRTIHFIPQLPKTRNGKIVRRAIRAAYLGLDRGDLSTLENPDALSAIQALQGSVSNS